MIFVIGGGVFDDGGGSRLISTGVMVPGEEEEGVEGRNVYMFHDIRFIIRFPY